MGELITGCGPGTNPKFPGDSGLILRLRAAREKLARRVTDCIISSCAAQNADDTDPRAINAKFGTGRAPSSLLTQFVGRYRVGLSFALIKTFQSGYNQPR